ncbi:MAG: pitrilysin family protein [Candidatus Omnitrophota bacterium]
MYKIREYGNSLKLVYRKMEGVSSVALGFWVNTGSRNESPEINGISHFLEHLLFKGSKKYTGDQIKESIEGIGGALNAFTSEENTCYYAKFLGRHLRKVFTVLSDMVLHPVLKRKDIEKERTVIIEEIKMYKDLPQFQVAEVFDELLWPDHPLGRNIAGSSEKIKAMKPVEIETYHKNWYRPMNMVVACAGNLDEELLEEHVEKTYSRLAGGEPGLVQPFIPHHKGPQIRLISKEFEQTHLHLGFPSFSRTHKDRFALGLVHVILGGNMSSRLFNEVREKKGLAYEIGTHVKKLKDTGVFFVHAGIDTRNLLEAVKVIFRELDRIRTEKVGPRELRRAKDFLIAQSEMALDDTMEHMLWIGDSMLNTGFLQTKEDIRRQIERITALDVRRVSEEIISWRRLHLAALGPQIAGLQDRIRGMAEKL